MILGRYEELVRELYCEPIDEEVMRSFLVFDYWSSSGAFKNTP